MVVVYDTLELMGDRRLREGLVDTVWLQRVLTKAYGECALKAIQEPAPSSQFGGLAELDRLNSGRDGQLGSWR